MDLSDFDIRGFSSGSYTEEDSEFIPLMTSEDEEQMNAEEVPQALPILPFEKYSPFSRGSDSYYCREGQEHQAD